MRFFPVASILVSALAMTACAKPPASTQIEPAAPATSTGPAAAQASPPAAAPARVTGGPAPVAMVMEEASFSGFGNLRLGSSVEEAKAAWGGELQGAPVQGSTCHYLMPKWVKDRRELAFMMEDGKFVRYDVGSTKLVAPGGGKVGMGLEELKALYHGALQAAPHKYIEGGQTLSLDASGVAPSRLVFEVDAAGKVAAWWVGLAPQVDYLEGCS